MSKRSGDELHAFLNAEGRELVNVKFWPGHKRGLTPDQLAEAAKSMLQMIIADGINKPPSSGLSSARLPI